MYGIYTDAIEEIVLQQVADDALLEKLSDEIQDLISKKYLTGILDETYDTIESVNNKISIAKSEVIGGAGKDYDTLKEIETWITEHNDVYEGLIATLGTKTTLDEVKDWANDEFLTISDAENKINTIMDTHESDINGIKTKVDELYGKDLIYRDSERKSVVLGTGKSVATGVASTAEGEDTTASGGGSHAEGQYTIAQGSCSHTEGHNTVAKGSYTHAEGCSTIANNYAEHAQGKYNISSSDTLSSIGNGNDKNRHNAFEVKMDGTIFIVDTNSEEDDVKKPMINLQEKLLGIEDYVNSRFNAVDGICSNKLTKEQADNLYQPAGNYLTSHQSLENYATITFVNEKFDSIKGYDDTELKNRIIALESKEDKDTVYDDSDLRSRIEKLESKEDKDTLYDDSELRGRIVALEGKTDNDTIYDDTELRGRIEELESRTDNNTIYDDSDIKERLSVLESKDNKDTVYDDSDLRNKISELQNIIIEIQNTIKSLEQTDTNE